jgi:competence protein ComFC
MVTGQSRFGKHAPAWLNAAGDAVVSVFFPAGCRLCDQLLTRATRVPICDECFASFCPLPPSVCTICGAPVVTPFSTVPGAASEPETLANLDAPSRGCLQCQGRTFAHERALSYAAYGGQLAKTIILLKFERVEPLAAWLAEKLAIVATREAVAADIVVPVPLHSQRESERGYNQAGLFARPLAKRLGLPYRPVLLMRTKPRPDKRVLSFSERWESVRGAFATRPGSRVDNLRVLLIDDVRTTGATLDACSKALLLAGAKSVVGLTVARAVRHPLSSPDVSRSDEF